LHDNVQIAARGGRVRAKIAIDNDFQSVHDNSGRAANARSSAAQGAAIYEVSDEL